jgi:hypothetical protein
MWQSLLDTSTQSLSGAVFYLLVATFVGLVAFIARSAFEFLALWLRGKRERRRALIDFTVELQRRRLNLATSFSSGYIENLKQRIRYTPGETRLYVMKTTSHAAFERMADHKHSFSEREAALLDTYIAHACMWDQQYEKLGSEEFGQLSLERKFLVLDNFGRASENVRLLGDRVLSEIGELRELANLCKLDDLMSPEDPLAGPIPSAEG